MTDPALEARLSNSLTVDDIQESLRWYRDVLGFDVVQTMEHEGELQAVMLRAGDAGLLINQDDGAKGWAVDREDPEAHCPEAKIRPPRPMGRSRQFGLEGHEMDVARREVGVPDAFWQESGGEWRGAHLPGARPWSDHHLALPAHGLDAHHGEGGPIEDVGPPIGPLAERPGVDERNQRIEPFSHDKRELSLQSGQLIGQAGR